MMPACLFSFALLATGLVHGHHLLHKGGQGVNLWKLQSLKASASTSNPGLVIQNSESADEDALNKKFVPQWFTQPLDHFQNSSSHSFQQRFWVNTRHYKPGSGAPVIVIDGGETSGEDRLPFLDTGIANILARATGGVGVVLEHRYYGKSVPVMNFTTDSLRWLNNAQSAADSANFMANVKFEGIEENLTAPKTRWIYYGGSYAGARAAHMKVLYPDLVFGAIASSGVTHASLENWEYNDIIRLAADPKCSSHLVGSISTIDSVLKSGPKVVMKGMFGLAGLKHDEDFASLLELPLGHWQSKVWDPAVGSTKFEEFCKAIIKSPFGFLDDHEDLAYGDPARMVEMEDGLILDFAVLNYAKYVKENIVSECPEGMTVEECFGTFDDAKFQGTTLDQTWRLWLFQVCTEWGYFSTAPPDQNEPTIVSRLLTLQYVSRVCHQSFPRGKHFAIPSMPNISSVNSLGNFEIAADRLAIIDGEVDPWRAATPHSDYAPKRRDTITRPFKLIPNGVHHYDEYGLSNIFDEPEEILNVHREMIYFIKEWLKDDA